MKAQVYVRVCLELLVAAAAAAAPGPIFAAKYEEAVPAPKPQAKADSGLQEQEQEWQPDPSPAAPPGLPGTPVASRGRMDLRSLFLFVLFLYRFFDFRQSTAPSAGFPLAKYWLW